MALKLPIIQDGVTARFVAVARAVQVGGLLPKESAKALVAEARAIRLLTEAREPEAAVRLCDGIDAWLDEEDRLFSDEVAMIKRHTDAVRRALR